MLVSQRHGKARDDARQDVQQLCCTVKLMRFVDQGVEAFVHGLSDHLSARNQLGVELVQNILEVVALYRLLRIEQVKELLYELRRDIDLERADLHGFIDDELEEELIYALQVGPRRIHLFFLINTSFSEIQVALFDVRKGPENVFLDHLHDLV